MTSSYSDNDDDGDSPSFRRVVDAPSDNFKNCDYAQPTPPCFRRNKTVQEMKDDSWGFIKNQERIVELIFCISMFVFGNFLPVLWNANDATPNIPYQETQAGDVILELNLAYPLVESETVPRWMLLVMCVVVTRAKTWPSWRRSSTTRETARDARDLARSASLVANTFTFADGVWP